MGETLENGRPILHVMAESVLLMLFQSVKLHLINSWLRRLNRENISIL